jgi:polysaccharide export outer membrane protein
MMQNRKRTRNDRQLPDTDTACRKRALDPRPCLFASLVAAALASAGCQTTLPPLPNPPSPKTTVRLLPGDSIKVAFADENVQDITEKIRRDGKISLPLIGELTAAGKRLMELQNEIKSRYEGRLDNPEVLVLLESGMASAIVAGFATKPGKIDFDRPRTVYQVVMQAGGATDYGSLSNVHLTRIIDGEQRTETINLRPTVHGKPTIPKYVQDGDVIYISRNWF